MQVRKRWDENANPIFEVGFKRIFFNLALLWAVVAWIFIFFQFDWIAWVFLILSFSAIFPYFLYRIQPTELEARAYARKALQNEEWFKVIRVENIDTP